MTLETAGVDRRVSLGGKEQPGALRRPLLGAATAIAADAYDEPTDIPLALDRAEQRLFALRAESANAQLRHITASLQQNYEHLTDRMERPFEVSGLPSGFREIDY